MITLITAAPGGGKTAYVVGNIMQQAEHEGRPLWVAGIPDLLVPHVPVPALEQWTELRESPEEPGLMLPYFTFPEGSLVILDEAQRYFRIRPNGSKVPDVVQAFETHRHCGIDFVLMTQHPQLIDNNVRKLVGRHIHFRDLGILGRFHYEWPEANDPGQFRTAPVKKKYFLPKKYFQLYKSSSKHIKPTRSIPPVLILLIIALIAFAYFGISTYRSLSAKNHKEPKVQDATHPISPAPVGGMPGQLVVDPGTLLTEGIPVLADRPETAPMYDALRVVRQMPEVQGCLKFDSTCRCYTQQGTIASVSVEACQAWMANRPFNPYKTPPPPIEVAQEAPLPPRSPVISLPSGYSPNQPTQSAKAPSGEPDAAGSPSQSSDDVRPGFKS